MCQRRAAVVGEGSQHRINRVGCGADEVTACPGLILGQSGVAVVTNNAVFDCQGSTAKNVGIRVTRRVVRHDRIRDRDVSPRTSEDSASVGITRRSEISNNRTVDDGDILTTINGSAI